MLALTQAWTRMHGHWHGWQSCLSRRSYSRLMMPDWPGVDSLVSSRRGKIWCNNSWPRRLWGSSPLASQLTKPYLVVGEIIAGIRGCSMQPEECDCTGIYAFVIGVASRLRVTASQEGCVAAAPARPGGASAWYAPFIANARGVD